MQAEAAVNLKGFTDISNPSFGSSVIFNTKIGIFLDFAPLFMGVEHP